MKKKEIATENKVTKTAKTDLAKIEKKAESKKAAKSSVKISSFKKKKKIKRNITSGVAYVYSTFNNTIISIADESGNVIAWSSAGAKGFKGSRKSTPYAAQIAADDAGSKAFEQGVRTLTVQVKGPGSGRETALRSLQSKGFKILSIKDTRVNQLSEDQVLKIREFIDGNHKVEGDLRREISLNIKRLLDLATYRGSRHKKKLPVRGQRTHCNARTRKGKAIAIAGKKLTPLKK